MAKPALTMDELLARTQAHLENLRALGFDSLGDAPAQNSAPAAASSAPPATASGITVPSLEEVRQVLGDCTRCKLHKGRNKIVFGSGHPHAQLLFIGEGPGADEDEQGLPFVGRAGQLLTKIIEAIGMKREEVYICNTVKCRPPNNRNPEPDELTSCEPFWRGQVKAVNPRVIVTLGNIATQKVLATTEGISKLRGRFHDFEGIALMPTYHPAFLLRSPDMKKHTWEDMKLVRDRLQNSAAGAA